MTGSLIAASEGSAEVRLYAIDEYGDSGVTSIAIWPVVVAEVVNEVVAQVSTEVAA